MESALDQSAITFLLTSLQKRREIQSTSYIHATSRLIFPLEFFLGPLLENYLLNLGITDVVAEGL